MIADLLARREVGGGGRPVRVSGQLDVGPAQACRHAALTRRAAPPPRSVVGRSGALMTPTPRRGGRLLADDGRDAEADRHCVIVPGCGLGLARPASRCMSGPTWRAAEGLLPRRRLLGTGDLVPSEGELGLPQVAGERLVWHTPVRARGHAARGTTWRRDREAGRCCILPGDAVLASGPGVRRAGWGRPTRCSRRCSGAREGLPGLPCAAATTRSARLASSVGGNRSRGWRTVSSRQLRRRGPLGGISESPQTGDEAGRGGGAAVRGTRTRRRATPGTAGEVAGRQVALTPPDAPRRT